MRKLTAAVLLAMIAGCPGAVEQPVAQQQAPADVAPIGASVEDFQNATWLVIGASDVSYTFATAFAVDPFLLATSAHVSSELMRLAREPGAQFLVVQHETGNVREIETVWVHPAYKADSFLIRTPDVGLLEVSESASEYLELPDSASITTPNVFDRVSLCGFPASITVGIDIAGVITTGMFLPRVSCLSGEVSATRPFDPGVPATEANRTLIQYDISTELGMSGSAVFDSAGVVVGVHALGFSDEAEQNFAIRVDKLNELIGWASNNTVGGVDLRALKPLPAPETFTCEPICIEDKCDSDCDGWFDSTELVIDTDPCSPFDPPFAPSPGTHAGVCDPSTVSIGVTGCIPICNSAGYCDPDCDGWFDTVELTFGFDPCNPFTPSFSPDTPATVCSDLINGKATGSAKTIVQLRKLAQEQAFALGRN